MTKRYIAFILIISIFCMHLSLPASAQMDSSEYIAMTYASLSQGNSSGKLIVDYSITGTSKMDTIGVSKIKVYRSNGSWYQTIYGTVGGGLLKQNKVTVTDSYTLSCVSGQSYYCEVTLYAAKGSGSDSRTITTGTVTAP